jgi:hypothetical protein
MQLNVKRSNTFGQIRTAQDRECCSSSPSTSSPQIADYTVLNPRNRGYFASFPRLAGQPSFPAVNRKSGG